MVRGQGESGRQEDRRMRNRRFAEKRRAVERYAEYIGMDVERDRELMWLAVSEEKGRGERKRNREREGEREGLWGEERAWKGRESDGCRGERGDRKREVRRK